MRTFFLSVILFASCQGVAQTIKGDFDLTSYPNISFVWNEYNPNLKDSTQFILTSADGKIPLNIQNLPHSDTVSKNKTILFLWEDLNHRQHAGQSKFTRTVLSRFLKEAPIQAGDEFNVAVFDRKGGNDHGSSIHTLLSNDFTSDNERLAVAVQNFKSKYDFFSNQANSELYMAIEEGIEMLQKAPADRIRAIVAFTAGSNQDSYGGRNSIDENRTLSLKIPVYAVKYPITGCDHCSNIDVICQKTFGLQITTNNVAEAVNLLKDSYGKMNERQYGQDYQISFTSNFPRDGKQHTLVLSVNGKYYPLSFTAPAFSLKVWLKEHVLPAILMGAGLLLIIALIAFFIYRFIMKRREELWNLEYSQEEIREEANASRQNLEDFRRQKEAEEKQSKAREQEQYFRKLMHTKNLIPRLQYFANGEKLTFTVNKPEISIGRDIDNDLILTSDSVSRHHAVLIFKGNGFEIQDLGSTNKVIVNGAFVERALLNNGDIIGLGEVVVYYYI